MSSNKKIFLLVNIAVLIFFVRSAVAQEIAPDFNLTDIDGIQFSLSDYTEKVVLLDFFATWCGPCISEIPHLKSLHEKFGEDLVIISISVSSSSDTVESLLKFRQEHEMNWIIARDTIGVSDKYGVQYIPTLVIVDQEGYIQHRHVGLTEESVLHGEIVKIVPEFWTWPSIILLFLTLTVTILVSRKSTSNILTANKS